MCWRALNPPDFRIHLMPLPPGARTPILVIVTRRFTGKHRPFDEFSSRPDSAPCYVEVTARITTD